MDNLFLLILIPLIGALVLAFVKTAKIAKQLALVISLISAAVTVPFLMGFDSSGGMQFEQTLAWLPELNIFFHIGLDGISLPLVLLTNLLVPLIILVSFSYPYKGNFFAFLLSMQAGLLLVFTALDAFSFYVGWELALIPIYFINALWGGENKIRINLKFFIYTFLGSLLMLVAIIYLSTQVPGGGFALSSFYQLSLDGHAQGWVFWAFFLAFAIKMPIFPFHTWQPDTYTMSPTSGTMMLSGIMLKMGVYGLIRWLIPVAPLGFASYGLLALILCIIGVVYGSIIAFKQSDAKRLIAYSSLAHVGLIGAGVFAWNQHGLQGAIVQMFNHGITVIGLFLVVDIVSRRLQTRDMSQMGGLAKVSPALAVFFLVIVMGAVGLPMTHGFIGEFLLLMGIYQVGIWYAIFGGLTLILGAVYMLRMYQRMMFGPADDKASNFASLKSNEWIVLSVVTGLILVIGIYPQPLLDLSSGAVSSLIEQVNAMIK